MIFKGEDSRPNHLAAFIFWVPVSVVTALAITGNLPFIPHKKAKEAAPLIIAGDFNHLAAIPLTAQEDLQTTAKYIGSRVVSSIPRIPFKYEKNRQLLESKQEANRANTLVFGVGLPGGVNSLFVVTMAEKKKRLNPESTVAVSIMGDAGGTNLELSHPEAFYNTKTPDWVGAIVTPEGSESNTYVNPLAIADFIRGVNTSPEIQSLEPAKR